MTLSTVINFARIQAQTDSNGLTDAKAIVFANEALQDFHRKLVTYGTDASQLQESYMTGTAGQGTYLYPTDMLFLKAIEVDYTNQGATSYLKAEQVDISNLQGTSFSFLRANQPQNSPLFDDHGDWFEIFPTPVGDVLIRIFYFLEPTEYTSVSDTVAYPESLDTALMGWRIAASWYYSLNKMNEGDAFNNKYEERVKQYIQTLSRGTQQPTQAQGLQISGWEF